MTHSEAETVLSGAEIILRLKEANIEVVLSVPDIVTSEGLLVPISKDKDFRLIRVTKEDEAVGISAGLSYCNKRALLLIQSTGFYYSVNALRAVGIEYGLPIVMLIGLLEKEPDLLPQDSEKYSVRLIEPMLDVMGVKRHLLQSAQDIEAIPALIEEAYRDMKPVAILVGRSPV